MGIGGTTTVESKGIMANIGYWSNDDENNKELKAIRASIYAVHKRMDDIMDFIIRMEDKMYGGNKYENRLEE